MKKTLTAIFFMAALACNIKAQTSRDSLNFLIPAWDMKLLSSRLDKQLNTFNLYGTMNLGQSFRGGFAGIREIYNSTMIRSTPKNIKDEHFFSFITEYNIVENIHAGLYANNSILSDDRKIALNQASVSDVSMYLKYQPEDRIYLSPFGGYSLNNQIGEKDNGYLYGFEGIAQGLSVSDFLLLSSVKYMNEDISPRKNSLRFFTFSLSNDMKDAGNNSLSGFFSENRKDFYFPSDSSTSAQFNISNNIQSRIETNYFIEDRFHLPDFYEGISFEFAGRAVWRAIDRNTRYIALTNISPSVFDARVDEFRLEFETSARYHSSSLDGILKINYADREEKHNPKKFAETNIFRQDERTKAFEERNRQEAQKNNKAERISVSLSANMKLSSRDNIYLSLFQNKLRYDTPSSENYDDRDELLTMFRLYYIRNISSYFDAFVNLEGTFNHIVYIYSQRSSNNNINRFLKLSSGGNIRNSFISSKNLFEVSANYTVYDFEDINPTYKSFSFRQLTLLDSSSVFITRNAFFSISGYLKYSEQGDFHWKSFSGRPTRYLNEYYFEPKINCRYGTLTFGSGIRLLLLNTYSFSSGIQRRESQYRSLGPVADLNLRMADRLAVRFMGWYEFIKAEQNARREVANMNMYVNWEL